MGNEFGHPEWVDFPREGNGQGLTLVNFPAQRKPILWDTLGV